jgi:hypothetical protein
MRNRRTLICQKISRGRATASGDREASGIRCGGCVKSDLQHVSVYSRAKLENCNVWKKKGKKDFRRPRERAPRLHMLHSRPRILRLENLRQSPLHRVILFSAVGSTDREPDGLKHSPTAGGDHRDPSTGCRSRCSLERRAHRADLLVHFSLHLFLLCQDMQNRKTARTRVGYERI